MIEEFSVNPSSVRADGNIISDQFKNGSDFKLVNNQLTNVISNHFPPNIADGGSTDGSTDGFTEYQGASIEIITLPNKYYGENGVKVTTPGTVANEGVKTDLITVTAHVSHRVTMAVVGEAGATLQMYLAEGSSGGTFMSAVGSGLIDMTGSPQFIDVSKTFTTGTQLDVVIQTDYAIQSTEFVVLGGMLDCPDVWIPGGTTITDESVMLHEAQTPIDTFIRGAFVEDESVFTDDPAYTNIEAIGGTHVWYLDHYMQYDNATCKSQLENSLARVAETNLKFHFCVLPFVKEGLAEIADPADLEYRAFFLAQIEDIINTYPQIEGISLNDYYYPDAYWLTETPEQRTQNRQDLIDFATAVRDLVHSHGLIFSINLIDPASHDAYVEDLAPICDYIMPEIYRGMGTAPTGVSLQAQHRWYAQMLEEYILKSGTTLVLPSFITYDDHANPESPHYLEGEVEYTTEDIIRDINIIFDHDLTGYVMCEYGYMPLDMYLPDGKSADTKHQFSRRITTQGLIAGEGVKLPEGTLIADLQLKIPLDKVLNIYTDETTYETVVGTGNWQSFNDIFDPTDPAYQISTESTSQFTCYCSVPHEGYVVDNSIVTNIAAGDLPTVGDSYIRVDTPGVVTHEGLYESPVTVEIDEGDSVWHSMYVKGSGTVVLKIITRDANGVGINSYYSDPLTLTNSDQELKYNTTVTDGVLINFNVLTNSIQNKTFFADGVYINKGDAPRTGKNLASDNVANTGSNGTTDGFIGVNGAIISPQPQGDGIQLQLKPQIKFMYLYDTLTQTDFDNIASKGFTDVCYFVGNIQDGPNYDAAVATTNTMIGYAHNAGLNYHAGIKEFKKTDGTYYNPTYLDGSPSPLATAMVTFINACPGLDGIQFDDFVYPDAYYDAGQLTTQRATMVSIATKCYTAISALGVTFSIAMYEGKAALYSQIAPHCDYLLPESTHRYNSATGIYDNTDPDFVINAMNDIKSKVGGNKVIPALMTFKNSADHYGTLWDKESLEQDINDVLTFNQPGFALFCYPYIVSNVKYGD